MVGKVTGKSQLTGNDFRHFYFDFQRHEGKGRDGVKYQKSLLLSVSWSNDDSGLTTCFFLQLSELNISHFQSVFIITEPALKQFLKIFKNFILQTLLSTRPQRPTK